MGMFTELGIALTKYHPERVMEHLRIFWSRINIPKMIRATEESHMWPELIFLYIHYDEWDNAVLAMMERASDAWDHQSLKDTIVKVTNLEIYYRALGFYLEQQPTLLTDLLQALTPRIDVNRVVKMFVKSDNIPLIKPFLLSVQSQNKREVNNALNDLLIEEEDYKTLRDSVQNNDNYDPVELAQRLEKHDLVFFRQIAANIYRKNKRWDKSIALSKQDKLFKDAIETAAMSGKPEVVEELLRYVSHHHTLCLYSSANPYCSSSILAAASATSVCSMHATILSAQTSFSRFHGAAVFRTSPWYVQLAKT
jgi:clathrin heavy chain